VHPAARITAHSATAITPVRVTPLHHDAAAPNFPINWSQVFSINGTRIRLFFAASTAFLIARELRAPFVRNRRDRIRHDDHQRRKDRFCHPSHLGDAINRNHLILQVQSSPNILCFGCLITLLSRSVFFRLCLGTFSGFASTAAFLRQPLRRGFSFRGFAFVKTPARAHQSSFDAAVVKIAPDRTRPARRRQPARVQRLLSTRLAASILPPVFAARSFQSSKQTPKSGTFHRRLSA